MIAASGILVVIAFVTLILGVFRTGLGLIWTSIAASILAAIFLMLGVVQGNKRRVATAGAPSPEPMAAWSDRPAAAAVLEPEAEPVAETAILTRAEGAPDDAFMREEPEPVVRPRKSAAAGAKTAAGGQTVVIIPDRDKYHKETCRYAKNAAAMTIPKSSARRQGYKPCGVCKP